MKDIFKRIAIGVFALLFVLPLAACGNKGPDMGDDNMAKLTYPDFAQTPGDKNSWEYMGDEELTINWYVDVSSWSIPTENDVIRKIKEDTGITVKFTTPVTDDGQKLATMIAGEDLPDVISATTANSKTLASPAAPGWRGLRVRHQHAGRQVGAHPLRSSASGRARLVVL